MKYLKFNSIISENNSKTYGFCAKRLMSFIKYIFPKANPDFDDEIKNVSIWLLEFEEDENFPVREIGININDNVIVKMPFKKNYGYWTDNNLKYIDFTRIFTAIEISRNEFLKKWNELQ